MENAEIGEAPEIPNIDGQQREAKIADKNLSSKRTFHNLRPEASSGSPA